MTALENLKARREQNKVALVAAHRSGDWESARALSQEKQRLKKQARNRCWVCGVALSPNTFDKQPGERTCQMHMPQLHSMKASRVRLNAPWSPPPPLLSGLTLREYRHELVKLLKPHCAK